VHASRANRDNRPEGVGVCSTRPSLTGETPATAETGVDTLRLLFETRDFGDRAFDLDGLKNWRFGSVPALGLTWAEGHPSPDGLATPQDVLRGAESVRERVDDLFGVMSDRGASRADLTTTRPFGTKREARAFLAGMATLQLPRCETTRRGDPVHSIAWTHASGRRKLARCYDKGMERGGEAFRNVRLEDQRTFRSGSRPPVDVVADPEFQRERFLRRFAPMRKAADGVKAMTFPVMVRELADQAAAGKLTGHEVERLAGTMVLLTGAAGNAHRRATMYRRRRELRESGYVLVDGDLEPVEVNLGEVLEETIADFGVAQSERGL
jgi:hypothetical protein